MKEPWFIGVLIGVIGGTLWLALCVFQCLAVSQTQEQETAENAGDVQW